MAKHAELEGFSESVTQGNGSIHRLSREDSEVQSGGRCACWMLNQCDVRMLCATAKMALVHSIPYLLQTFHTWCCYFFIVKLLFLLSNCVVVFYTLHFIMNSSRVQRLTLGRCAFTQTWCLGKSVLDISKCNNGILQSSRKKDGGTFCGFQGCHLLGLKWQPFWEWILDSFNSHRCKLWSVQVAGYFITSFNFNGQSPQSVWNCDRLTANKKSPLHVIHAAVCQCTQCMVLWFSGEGQWLSTSVFSPLGFLSGLPHP